MVKAFLGLCTVCISVVVVFVVYERRQDSLTVEAADVFRSIESQVRQKGLSPETLRIMRCHKEIVEAARSGTLRRRHINQLRRSASALQ